MEEIDLDLLPEMGGADGGTVDLDSLPEITDRGAMSRPQGDSPIPLTAAGEAAAKGELGITETAQKDYEAATGAEAPQNPILAQIANMGLTVGGRLNANLQMQAAQKLAAGGNYDDRDMDDLMDQMVYGGVKKVSNALETVPSVVGPGAEMAMFFHGKQRQKQERVPNEILHDWDETEGRRYKDPDERRVARMEYARQIATDFIRERSAVRQNAETELKNREVTHTANVVSRGLGMLGYTAPYLLGPVGILAQLAEEGSANAVGYANDEYGYDKGGNFVLISKGDTPGRAALAGFGTVGIETATEVVGGKLGGAVLKRAGKIGGKALGSLAGKTVGRFPVVKKVGEAVGATAARFEATGVGRAVAKFGRGLGRGLSSIFKWTSKNFHLENPVEENIEEYESDLLNALTGFDRRASELVDPETGERTNPWGRFVDANREFFSKKHLVELNEAMLLTMGGGAFVAQCARRGAVREVDNFIREHELMGEAELKEASLEKKSAALDAWAQGLDEKETLAKINGASGWLDRLADKISGKGGKFAGEVNALREKMAAAEAYNTGAELDELELPHQKFDIPMVKDARGRNVPDFRRVSVLDVRSGETVERRAVFDDSGICISDNGKEGDSAYTVFMPGERTGRDFATLTQAVRFATNAKNARALDAAKDAMKRKFIGEIVRRDYGGANVIDVKTIGEAVEASRKLGQDVTAAEGFRTDRAGWHLKDGTVVLVRDNIHSPIQAARLLRHENVGHSAELMRDPWLDSDADSQIGRLRDANLANAARGGGVTEEQKERILRESVANAVQRRRHVPGAGGRVAHGIREALRKAGFSLKMNDADLEVVAARVERDLRKGADGSHVSQDAAAVKDLVQFMEPAAGTETVEAEKRERPAGKEGKENGNEAGTVADEEPARPEQGTQGEGQEGKSAPATEETPVAAEGSPSMRTERDFLRVMHDNQKPVRVPVGEVSLPDTQFKEGADPKTGVVKGQELKGEYFESAENAVVVYVRKDGTKELVTGRHRFDLARRTGKKDILARLFYEKDGYTPEDMRNLDAISNIIDEKGTEHDYIRYFENAKPSRAAAEAAGFLSRSKGRLAFELYEGATEGTRSAVDWSGSGADGLISVEQAGIIAKAAPRNAHPRNGAVQRILVKKAQDGLRGDRLAILARSLAEDAKSRKTPATGGEMQLLAQEEKRAAKRVERANEYGRIANVLQTAMQKGGRLDLNRAYAKELGIRNPKDRKQLADARQKALEKAEYWRNTVRLDEADKAALDAELGIAPKENLELESVTGDQIAEENRKRAEKEEIERRKAAPLKGGAGESGQSLMDLGGAEGEDLFNRTQRAEPAAPRVAVFTKKDGTTEPIEGYVVPREGDIVPNREVVVQHDTGGVINARRKIRGAIVSVDGNRVKVSYRDGWNYNAIDTFDRSEIVGVMPLPQTRKNGPVSDLKKTEATARPKAAKPAEGQKSGATTVVSKVETTEKPAAPKPKAPKTPSVRRGERVLLKGMAEGQRVTFLKDNGDGTADVQVKTPGANRYMPEKVETRTVKVGDIGSSNIKDALSEEEYAALRKGIEGQGRAPSVRMKDEAAERKAKAALDAIDFNTPELDGLKSKIRNGTILTEADQRQFAEDIRKGRMLYPRFRADEISASTGKEHGKLWQYILSLESARMDGRRARGGSEVYGKAASQVRRGGSEWGRVGTGSAQSPSVAYSPKYRKLDSGTESEVFDTGDGWVVKVRQIHPLSIGDVIDELAKVVYHNYLFPGEKYVLDDIVRHEHDGYREFYLILRQPFVTPKTENGRIVQPTYAQIWQLMKSRPQGFTFMDLSSRPAETGEYGDYSSSDGDEGEVVPAAKKVAYNRQFVVYDFQPGRNTFIDAKSGKVRFIDPRIDINDPGAGFRYSKYGMRRKFDGEVDFDTPELGVDSTIVSGDEVRKTMPGYNRLDWSTHVDRTGYVGPRLEAQFRHLLKTRKGKGDGTVVFLAGGNGAGKSTVATKIGNSHDFTIDSTLGNLEVAKKQIDAILANGQTPEIHFVYRTPGQALEGIAQRVKNGGHIVSPLSFANSHVKSRENLRLLSEAYGDKIHLHIYDNSVDGAPEITLKQLEAKGKPDHERIRESANYYLGHLREREEARSRSQGGVAGGGAKGEASQVDFDTPELYTGSAADYERPSLHYVGTGEGSQAYGWGLYASNRRGVAESYAKAGVPRGRNLPFMRIISDNGTTRNGRGITLESVKEEAYADKNEYWSDKIAASTDNPIDARKDAKKYGREIEKYFNEHFHEYKFKYDSAPGSHLYEQTWFADRAPGDESHLLKWYEPVSEEQKAWIEEQAKKEGFVVGYSIIGEKYIAGPNVGGLAASESGIIPEYWHTGEDAYRAIGRLLGSPKAASEFLARAGIDGVKYPVDSYGKAVKDGDEAGWNYVSFRDDNIRVDHKWTDGEIQFDTPELSPEGRREHDSVVARYTNADGTKKPGWMKAPNGKPTKLMERQWVQVRTPSFKKWFGDWEGDPANASKVVDENGEPLVVYHGTETGGFSVFNGLKNGSSSFGLDGATFFSTSLETAKTYATSPKVGDISPFLVDAKEWLAKHGAKTQARWLDSNEWRFVDTDKEIKPPKRGIRVEYQVVTANNTFVPNSVGATVAESMRKAERSVAIALMPGEGSMVYSCFIRARNPYVVDFKGRNWRGDKVTGSTLDVARKAREEGFDCAIIKNVEDSASFLSDDAVSTSIAVFSPENIKSATDNNGDFSRTKADINFDTPELAAESHSRSALADIAAGKPYGILHNPKYGVIRYPLGRAGKGGEGFLHIVEHRMNGGASLDDAIDVAIKVGKAAEIGEETLSRYNTHHLDSNGVRAIIAEMPDHTKVITGYEIDADEKAAANRRAAELAPPPHVSSEEVITHLREIVSQSAAGRNGVSAADDAAYMDAVRRGDMETARRLLKAAWERSGYSPDTSYKDAHAAPSAPVEAKDFKNVEALNEARDEGWDLNLWAIANGITGQPDDFFSERGPRLYMYDDAAGRETQAAIASAIQSIRGGNDKTRVIVYRAVPNDVKLDGLQSGGQWVSPSKTYAENHGKSRFGDGAYRIVREVVRAENLWWDGNDAREWGYDDGRQYVYRNVENGMKLATVTYDDAGNVIPLSQRFDASNPDIMFDSPELSAGAQYDPRSRIPNVRGGWTEGKILRYLKATPSLHGVRAASRLIAEFASPEELKEHMFYHGTKASVSGLSPSITKSEEWAERHGGGGYGTRYWGVSVSKSKRVASSFGGHSPGVSIYPVVLAKGAKVVDRADLADADDVSDHIVELWNDGVDAVRLGDWKEEFSEQELLILNPRAICNVGTPDYYRQFRLRSPENPLNIKDDAQIAEVYEAAREYAGYSPFARFGKPTPPKMFENGELKPKEVRDAERAQYEKELEAWRSSEQGRAAEAYESNARNVIRFDSPELAPEARAREIASFTQRYYSRQRGLQRLAKPSADDFMDAAEGRWAKFRRIVQDKNLVIREVEERLGVTDKRESVYYAKDREFGLNEYQLGELQKRRVDPILDRLAETGASQRDFDLYLIARHAPYRNAVLRERGVTDGAGMGDAEAAEVIEGFNRLGVGDEFAAIADMVYAMNDEALQRRVDSGRVSPEEAETLRRTLVDYVPLRTDMENDERDAHNTYSSGWHQSEFRTAHGRRTLADSPLAWSIVQAERSIRDANANRVRQTAAALVRKSAAMGKPIGEIIPGTQVRRRWAFNIGGEVLTLEELRDRTDLIFFKEDGKLKAIRMNVGAHGLGNTFAQAVTDKDLVKFSKWFEWVPRLTRAMSAMRTQYVPTFIVRNLKADHLEVFFNVGSERGIVGGAKFFGRLVANEWRNRRDVRDYFRDGELRGRMKEFVENGGLTGGGMAAEGFSEAARRVDHTLRTTRGGVARKVAAAIPDAISLLNACAEFNTRVGVFSALRDEGVGVEDAVSYARDATVNFNRRGSLTPYLNAAFMFSNAAIQGLGRAFKSMRSEHGKQMVTLLFLVGFLQSLLDHFLGRDEDREKEGLSSSRNLSEHEKQSTVGVPLPGGLRLKTQIRNPWALPMYAGRKAGELLMGWIDGRTAVADLASAAGGFVTEPVGGNGFGSVPEAMQTFAPTLLDPFVQWATGVDFKGDRRLRKNYSDHLPDSWNGRINTPDVYKWISQGANAISGGSRFRKGAFDTSPENWQLLAETVLGGALADLNRAVSTVKDARLAALGAKPEQVLRDVPFVRDTLTNLPDVSSRYYDALSDYEADRTEYSGLARTDAGKAEAFATSHPWAVGSENPVVDIVWNLGRAVQEAETPSEAAKLRREQLAEMAGFVRRMEEARKAGKRKVNR